MYDEKAIVAYRTPCGLERFHLPVHYPSLDKHRYISSDTPMFAVHKATIQLLLWADMQKALTALRQKKLGLEMNSKRNDLKAKQKLKIAEARTEIAQQELVCSYQILNQALESLPQFEWDMLKHFPEFPLPKPKQPAGVVPPQAPIYPREPLPTDRAFLPQPKALDKVLRTRLMEKESEAKARFEAAHKQWELICRRIQAVHHDQMRRHAETVQQLKRNYEAALANWEAARAAYLREREQCVRIIEEKKCAYLESESHSVLDHCDMLLAHSKYPPCFPHSYELDYDAAGATLFVDYLLPPLRKLPRLRRIDYIESDDRFRELLLTEDERNVLYAKLLQEIPLRTFHELFASDVPNALAAIVFRGYLYLTDQGAAPSAPQCVIRIQADKASFSRIDLYHEDPAAVFETLGGLLLPLS